MRITEVVPLRMLDPCGHIVHRLVLHHRTSREVVKEDQYDDEHPFTYHLASSAAETCTTTGNSGLFTGLELLDRHVSDVRLLGRVLEGSWLARLACCNAIQEHAPFLYRSGCGLPHTGVSVYWESIDDVCSFILLKLVGYAGVIV